MSKKKKFVEVADDFLEFIKDKKLIIHNAEFDLAHLNNELSLIGKKPILINTVIDTLELARNKFPGSGISLDALCKRYSIDNSRRKKHTALIDCELLTKVYINLLDQKEPKLNFSIKENNMDVENFSKEVEYSSNVIFPSEQEIQLHKKFIKENVKKNYFS